MSIKIGDRVFFGGELCVILNKIELEENNQKRFLHYFCAYVESDRQTFWAAESELKMANEILNKTRCYLVGAIEAADDGGVNWRNRAKEALLEMGIIAYDPCDKPFIKDFSETKDMQNSLKQLEEEERFEELESIMKEIRIYDLNLVDRSDFIIFNYFKDIKTCGSWEEIFWANRLKKPIFFITDGDIPLWMRGTISHKYFYKSLDDVLETLINIHTGKKKIDSSRWRLLRDEFR